EEAEKSKTAASARAHGCPRNSSSPPRRRGAQGALQQSKAAETEALLWVGAKVRCRPPHRATAPRTACHDAAGRWTAARGMGALDSRLRGNDEGLLPTAVSLRGYGDQAALRSSKNCSSSVEPFSAA